MIDYDDSSTPLDNKQAVAWLRKFAPDSDKDLSDKDLFDKLKPAYINKEKQDLLILMQSTTQ